MIYKCLTIRLIISSLTFSFLCGCAPKARNAGGRMDDPPTHYKQGMKYWDAGDFVRAEEEFKLSNSLDLKFGPAYSGLALTTAQNAKTTADKESMEKSFKDALDLADKAQKLSPDNPNVFISKAIVITMQNEGVKPAKEWLGDIEKEYEKATKIDPLNSEAYYRRGLCYKKAYEFSKASTDFRKVLDLKQNFTTEANEQWELVQKIERAEPGTDVGKKIALVENISRADIAALFISELDIDKLILKKRPKIYNTDFQAPEDSRQMKTDSIVSVAQITDINEHWAKNFISDIVNIDIRGLEPYPDHTFHPDQLITRGEYALMVEDAIIAITGDQSLATKFIGTESRFPDVNSSHPVYNAICNAVDKNVMNASMNGEFGIDKPVSGPDALLIIRSLKDLNKIK
ncbi:MAG TPA: S-layer homology domain-containing protein [Chitinispirillaceae bacterium]|nr:S-layer homology domain-containing protein [Chitinispirillaceae bacterium]